VVADDQLRELPIERAVGCPVRRRRSEARRDTGASSARPTRRCPPGQATFHDLPSGADQSASSGSSERSSRPGLHPLPRDRHQDHQLVSELTYNTFRDHLVLEYEVMKTDGDLGNPNVYVPLDTTNGRPQGAGAGGSLAAGQTSAGSARRRSWALRLRRRGRRASGYPSVLRPQDRHLSRRQECASTHQSSPQASHELIRQHPAPTLRRRPVPRGRSRIHRARVRAHVWDVDGNEFIENGSGSAQ
jgi:hypothetical protein